jgi:hypothetical protein
MVDFSALMPNETKQNRQVAKVKLLETFTLGKNTHKNKGIEITAFSKANKELGTITIGAGSFQWWPTSAKKPELYLQWPDFATVMEEVAEVKERRKKEKRRRAKARKG